MSKINDFWKTTGNGNELQEKGVFAGNLECFDNVIHILCSIIIVYPYVNHWPFHFFENNQI